MNTYKSSSNAQACGAQVASETSAQAQYQQIKLALDVHAASIVVGRMIDGAKPQPPQSFKPADFLEWAKKQVTLAKEVISCYEAGPTGFWLHLRLTELGVRNYVVCPTYLDERRHGVANDRTEALELATRLDRYVAGNDRALAVVRVPTEAWDPKSKTSGETVKTPARISKMGSKRGRRALYMPALVALRYNPLIRALGQRLKAKGRSGNYIVVAAMRKLLRQIFGVLKSGQPFDPNWSKSHARQLQEVV